MLTNHDAEIVEERSARKQPLSDDEVQVLLGKVSTVHVAKGKKVVTFEAGETDLDALKGPTGNYRAPMVLTGDTLLVGFNRELAADLVSG
ncbi:MAG: ArsC family (seleno)protein [Acidobacteriota bacterium]